MMKAQNSTNCKKCNNCAWYCHADGKCYGREDRLHRGADMFAYIYKPEEPRDCSLWAFDGLEDWEREELDALMTMAEVVA